MIGTGRTGALTAKIMHGFGCELLGSDIQENPDCLELGMKYMPVDELLTKADVVTLHCPLTPETEHLINEERVRKMKRGVMLINTSRGRVVDTKAVIEGLKSGQIGSVGMDVYEEEADYFFEDLSNNVIADDVLARLLTFPNVLVTGHQAFFTREAMQAIADTTLNNLQELKATGKCGNTVSYAELKK